MPRETNTWALVLAAGEGLRLRKLTTTAYGTSVPKQFCSLNGGASLFEQALLRASTVAPTSRTCAIVASQHWIWWQAVPHSLPLSNVIVQPSNCGTANGILLSLLHILATDPYADILILPSDHYIREERILGAALEEAMQQLRRHPQELLLLGFSPQEPDSELGYILPRIGGADKTLSVDRFVEKPSPAQARQIIKQGALWNGFIIAAKGRSVLDLFQQRRPELLAHMRTSVQHAILGDRDSLPRLYAHLPTIDFSRDILQGQESRLRVLPVANCGWSDLGTVGRVENVLRHSPRSMRGTLEQESFLNLATQYELQHPPRSRPPQSTGAI
jgi:mannose-1-phosphate guanylyltransferase